jgi:iron complex outermembrane receptor protein
VEFSIGATIVSKSNFSWDASFNAARNKNKLTNFAQAPIQTAQINGQGVSGALAQVITNNQPVNVYFLKKFMGFDQAGQQIIAETPTFEGDPNPHLLMGLSNTLRFNKLSVTINAGGAFGYKVYNNTYNTVTNISNLQNGKNIAAIAITTTENINASVAASSRYLESGSFLKLRNMTFNYTLGDVGRNIKSLNVFVGCTNMFVITKFHGFDPEVNVDKNSNGYPSRNIEYLPYPTSRTINFGLNFGL